MSKESDRALELAGKFAEDTEEGNTFVKYHLYDHQIVKMALMIRKESQKEVSDALRAPRKCLWMTIGLGLLLLAQIWLGAFLVSLFPQESWVGLPLGCTFLLVGMVTCGFIVANVIRTVDAYSTFNHNF